MLECCLIFQQHVQEAPLDEELVLRATFKSRLSTRQRTINHRSDLVKELGTMSGAIEDFATTCWQVKSIHQFPTKRQPMSHYVLMQVLNLCPIFKDELPHG